MNEATIVALKKLLPAQELTAGQYRVDEVVTLRVTGTVTKGEDYETTPTGNLLSKDTLALILEKSGITRERSKAILIEAVTEGLLRQSPTTEAVRERIRDIDSALEHVRDITAALPKQVRSGSTTVKGNVQFVIAS